MKYVGGCKSEMNVAVNFSGSSHLSDSHLSESHLSDSHLSEFAFERIRIWVKNREVAQSMNLWLSLRNFPNILKNRWVHVIPSYDPPPATFPPKHFTSGCLNECIMRFFR